MSLKQELSCRAAATPRFMYCQKPPTKTPTAHLYGIRVYVWVAYNYIIINFFMGSMHACMCGLLILHCHLPCPYLSYTVRKHWMCKFCIIVRGWSWTKALQNLFAVSQIEQPNLSHADTIAGISLYSCAAPICMELPKQYA